MHITRTIRQISSRASNLLGSAISIFLPRTTSKPKQQGYRKIAFFTEGQTGQVFVEKLLIEIAGNRDIHIDSVRVIGGRKFPRILYSLTPRTDNTHHEYHALIVDCGGDERVASEVRDQYASLMTAGYTALVAIRDVAPDFTWADIPRLRAGITRSLPAAPVQPLLVLATMEVEAWFIGEHTHFPRLNTNLTTQLIQRNLGLNLLTDDIEQLVRPADDLHRMYQLVGLSYLKSRPEVERTVNVLDYDRVQDTLPHRTPSFAPLLQAVSVFLQ